MGTPMLDARVSVNLTDEQVADLSAQFEEIARSPHRHKIIIPPKEPVGRLRIEWPKDSEALDPGMCRLFNVDTGEPIFTVTRLVVDADCETSNRITADLWMLVNDEDEPLRAGDLIPPGVRTKVFRWVVAEMREQD